MPIADRVRPTLTIVGTVLGRADRTNNDGTENGVRVTVGTPDGPARVNFSKDNKGQVPPLGTLVALIVGAVDYDGGTSLAYVRAANENDADLFLSAAGLAEQRKAA